jgi:Flp pilus assembly protein TadB
MSSQVTWDQPPKKGTGTLDHKPPNRAQRRAEAQEKQSARRQIKANGHEFRHERLQRLREARELAEERQAEKRARLAREHGEDVQGRIVTVMQNVKASMKLSKNKGTVEIGAVVVALVVAMVLFWLSVSGRRRRRQDHTE